MSFGIAKVPRQENEECKMDICDYGLQKFYITQSATEDAQRFTEEIFLNPLGAIVPEGFLM